MENVEAAGSHAQKPKIVIEKDFNDHAGFATDIAESFSTGPSWCDVVLLIEDVKFYSCKGILAAVSPYFRQMFSSDFKDPSHREITLEGFTETGFKPIWDFIHGTKAEVEGEKGALATLRDAHFLGIKRLCQKMSKVFESLLKPENALLICDVAEQYGFNDLKEAGMTIIAKRFYQLIQNADFFSVSFETLVSVLDRDDLEISSEKEVYEAMRKWLDQDENRKRHLPELLDKIRLPLLPLEYRRTVVVKDPIISGNQRCIDLCMDGMTYHVSELRLNTPAVKLRNRGTLSRKIWCLGVKNNERMISCIDPNDWGMVVVTSHPGGAYARQAFRRSPTKRALAAIDKKLYLIGCGEMKIFDAEVDEWEEGPKPPDYIQWPAIASSASSLFICGNYNQQKRTVGGVLQFNAESSDWIHLRSMKYARYGAGSLYQDSVIHVIGGSYANGTKYERLDLRTPNWEELADHPRGTIYPGLAYAEGGEIVVAGGSGKKEVYAYDARKDAWQEWPSMVEERQGHGLISLNGTLYAVAGFWNSSVEVLDGDRWKVVKRLDLESCERACRMVL